MKCFLQHVSDCTLFEYVFNREFWGAAFRYLGDFRLLFSCRNVSIVYLHGSL